jgi:hypothetical protein
VYLTCFAVPTSQIIDTYCVMSLYFERTDLSSANYKSDDNGDLPGGAVQMCVGVVVRVANWLVMLGDYIHRHTAISSDSICFRLLTQI